MTRARQPLETGPQLVLFDPAFASAAVPVLLAPVKATFHNALAHPWWLYQPDVATERLTVDARDDGDVIEIFHDAQLSPPRAGAFASIFENVWAPLLGVLHERGLRPEDWRAQVRAALFC